MPQPRPPYTYQPPPPAEVDAKATVSEAIRAVRVIVDRAKLTEPSEPVTHPPQPGPEPAGRPRAT